MLATIDDARLLADYVQTRSPDALGRLIERHIDFVYSAAVRQVRDAALAEDVTQAVFIVLARKANSIRAESLAGWLFNTARHCAANARRGELRRRRHERQAAKSEVQMQTDDSSTVCLDHALARLGRSDREVVLLRYLQEREFAEVGLILGISEQTARRRLSRAIERLRRLLGARGEVVPSALVMQVLSGSLVKAPAHLTAATIASAGGHAAAGGTAVSLAARTIHLMTWLKVKVIAAIILATVVAGTGSVAIIKAVSPAPTADPATPSLATAASPVGAFNPAMPVGGAVAIFPDGMRLELIGVAPSPIRNQKWWHPDGSPLAQPPIFREYSRVIAQASKNYAFVVKLSGSDPTWDTGINVEGSNGVTSSDQGNLLCITSAIPQNATTATIDFLCGNGPWQTRASAPATDIFNTGITVNGVLFTSGDKGKDVSIKLSADHASMGQLFAGASRIVAIDLNGKEHGSTSMMGTGTFLTETRTVTFANLRVDQVVQFQIRSRPFNRSVKFHNISLMPGQLTAPTVEQHDTDKFLATFTAGGSVAVVGIANWPPSGTWWSPDGSPLNDIPPDYGPYTSRDAKSNERAYAIAVKTTDPQDNPSWSFYFPLSHAVGVPTGNPTVPAGSPTVYRVILPAADKTTDFRIGLACGPWHTITSAIPGNTPATTGDNGTQITFSPPQDKDGDVLITTIDDLRVDALHNVQRQLVATDQSGVAHTATIQNSKESAGKYTFRIPHIAKTQIKSYQFQTRENQYITFNGLPLAPGQPSNVTIEPDAAPPPPAPGQQGL